MKATLYKNDDFKTIGFYAETNEGAKIVFWGCANPSSWRKNVDFEKNAEIIFDIVNKMKEKSAYEQFIFEWFDIAGDNGIHEVLRNAGKDRINFSRIEEKVAQLGREIERKINEIK